jgi:hypothetical protein
MARIAWRFVFLRTVILFDVDVRICLYLSSRMLDLPMLFTCVVTLDTVLLLCKSFRAETFLY